MNLNEIEQELLRTLDKIESQSKRVYKSEYQGDLLLARATTLAALANIEIAKKDDGVIDESVIDFDFNLER